MQLRELCASPHPLGYPPCNLYLFFFLLTTIICLALIACSLDVLLDLPIRIPMTATQDCVD